MGIRWRTRTKGKNGWLNFSYSDKNGFNWSASAKSGPFTWNSGNGKTTRRRITTNLPGGFYHVTSTSKPTRSRKPRSSASYDSDSVLSALITVIIVVVGWSILMYNHPWLIIVTIIGGAVYWKLRTKNADV